MVLNFFFLIIFFKVAEILFYIEHILYFKYITE